MNLKRFINTDLNVNYSNRIKILKLCVFNFISLLLYSFSYPIINVYKTRQPILEVYLSTPTGQHKSEPICSPALIAII